MRFSENSFEIHCVYEALPHSINGSSNQLIRHDTCLFLLEFVLTIKFVCQIIYKLLVTFSSIYLCKLLDFFNERN